MDISNLNIIKAGQSIHQSFIKNNEKNDAKIPDRIFGQSITQALLDEFYDYDCKILKAQGRDPENDRFFNDATYNEATQFLLAKRSEIRNVLLNDSTPFDYKIEFITKHLGEDFSASLQDNYVKQAKKIADQILIKYFDETFAYATDTLKDSVLYKKDAKHLTFHGEPYKEFICLDNELDLAKSTKKESVQFSKKAHSNATFDIPILNKSEELYEELESMESVNENLQIMIDDYQSKIKDLRVVFASGYAKLSKISDKVAYSRANLEFVSKIRQNVAEVDALEKYIDKAIKKMYTKRDVMDSKFVDMDKKYTKLISKPQYIQIGYGAIAYSTLAISQDYENTKQSINENIVEYKNILNDQKAEQYAFDSLANIRSYCKSDHKPATPEIYHSM